MKTRIGCLTGLLFAILFHPAYTQQYSAFPAPPYQNLYKYYNSNLTVVTYQTISLVPLDPNAYVGRNDTYTPDDFRRRESFRMVYRWDISSIPDYAVIDNAKLTVDWYALSNKSGASTVKFYIKKFPADKWSASHEEKWNAVASAAKYDSISAPLSIPRNATDRTFSGGSTFCIDIKNNLAGNYFYLSLQTDDDESWGTGLGSIHQVDIERGQDHIDQGIELIINYHIPNYNVTVKNNYPGGSVYIDEVRHDNVPSEGVVNSWLGGTNHSVRAIDGQVVDGYTWNYGNWKNKDGQTVASTPNTSYSFQVTRDEILTASYTRQFVVSGTFTVGSGETRTFSPGDQIFFQPGAKLLVYGRLVANGTSSQRIAFTRVGSSGDYQGIEFSGSNNSSLQYCDITYATTPIKATNTSNLTIADCTIGNSAFGFDAAIALYGSTATISNTTITGIGWGYSTGFWNGIRFAQGSGGSVTNCLIQNVGYGNGIVIQGGSSPTILNTTIRNVYYHGFSIDGNGSGLPSLEGNIIDGARQYTAVRLRNSQAVLARNQLTNKGYAMYAEYFSSPRTPDNIPGGNSFSQNDHGLVAYYYSNPNIGLTRTNTNDPCFTYLFGACNYFSGNLYSDANAATGCYVTVQANYWPSYPPDPARFPVSDGSYIDYSLPRDPAVDPDCWNYICGGGGGGPLMIDPNTTSIARVIPDSFDVKKLLRQASRARLAKDFITAATIYRTLLLRAKQETDRAIALVGFLDLFRASKDQSFIGEIEQYRTAPGKLGVVASELLMSAYASTGRYGEAKALAYTHKAAHAGTEHEKYALLELVSLAGYTESERATAQAAYRELIQKFPDTDKGLLVAINPGVSEVEG
ncbi:MAG TPA: right-handed parallel beta-helix repeat-containing protein, partial [Bacteroidota bacterium]|nr:right-handed parallel beta-helix repeat-containing protein [Bacteroidota bacterium]